MRKIINVTYLILALVITYTVMWFVAGTILKGNIIEEINYIKEKNNIGISYSTINLEGFPNAIKIKLKNIEGLSQDKNIIFKTDHINFNTNLLANRIKIGIAKEFELKEGINTIKYSFNQTPNFIINLHNSLLFNKLPKLPEEFTKLWSNIESIHYNDQGYEQIINGKIANRGVKQLLNITHDLHNNTSSTDIVGESIGDIFLEKEMKIETKEDLNISVTAPDKNDKEKLFQELKISLKNFDFNTELFRVNASGEFASVKEEIIPVGKIDIKINNYQNLMNFYKEEFYKNIKSEKNNVMLDNVFKLFDKISVKDEKDPDLTTITISREVGRELYLGDMSIKEVIQFFQENIEQKEENLDIKK